MSKVLITADIHFGLPHKLEDILWSVKTIREYAARNDIGVVIVCGDLFHDRVNYNIEVLNRTYDFFKETREMGQEWIAFPGNHDMPLRNSWDINTLNPLTDVLTSIDNIKLVRIDGRRFWVVPFIHYESVYMKTLETIEESYEDGDVLLTHVGVNNATLNECFLIKHWSVVDFTNSKFDRIFTGHFHCYQNIGGKVWYPGSPIPFRYDEGMVPHGFIEYDLETRDVNFIKIFDLDYFSNRPSDYITIDDEILSEAKHFKGDNIRIQLTREYSQNELAQIRTDLEEIGVKSVKLNKLKQEKIVLGDTANNKLSLDSPSALFDKWIEHDSPKKLNMDLLKELNLELIKKCEHDL